MAIFLTSKCEVPDFAFAAQTLAALDPTGCRAWEGGPFVPSWVVSPDQAGSVLVRGFRRTSLFDPKESRLYLNETELRKWVTDQLTTIGILSESYE